jgi:hypothetical protein
MELPSSMIISQFWRRHIGVMTDFLTTSNVVGSDRPYPDCGENRVAGAKQKKRRISIQILTRRFAVRN